MVGAAKPALVLAMMSVLTAAEIRACLFFRQKEKFFMRRFLFEMRKRLVRGSMRYKLDVLARLWILKR